MRGRSVEERRQARLRHLMRRVPFFCRSRFERRLLEGRLARAETAFDAFDWAPNIASDWARFTRLAVIHQTAFTRYVTHLNNRTTWVIMFATIVMAIATVVMAWGTLSPRFAPAPTVTVSPTIILPSVEPPSFTVAPPTAPSR